MQTCAPLFQGPGFDRRDVTTWAAKADPVDQEKLAQVRAMVVADAIAFAACVIGGIERECVHHVRVTPNGLSLTLACWHVRLRCFSVYSSATRVSDLKH